MKKVIRLFKIRLIIDNYRSEIHWRIVSPWFYMPTKIFYKPTKARVRGWFNHKVKPFFTRMVDLATNRTVYFYESGTDCDGVSSGRAVEYRNLREAEKDHDSQYEWADGPLSFSRISKAEFNDAQPFFRDLGLEAFENGHPHVLRP